MDRQTPPRSARPLRPGFRHRWRSGHWAVAGIAAVLVILLQSSRDQLASPAAAPEWRLPAEVAVGLSTAWLISVAWCHIRLAQENGLHRRWPTLVQALGDFGVAGTALVILRQGHQSPLASAGVWLLPPTLLAVAVPSAILELASGLAARHAALRPEARLTSRAMYLFAMSRAASLMALLAWLIWLAMRAEPALKAPRSSPSHKGAAP